MHRAARAHDGHDGGMEIEALQGDITTQDVAAIVNAANSSLLGGGGVDGAIHRAAGPKLLEECKELRRTELPDGLDVGHAVPTAGYDLPAEWIIHTVGPNANRGQTDPQLLASCFSASLQVATDVGARTVAFPAISAGVFGWAMDEVARLGAQTVRDWQNEDIDLVRFVLFDETALAAFCRALQD